MIQETQKIRINKLLSQAGVASRREAEKLIHAGSVILNGKTVTEPGQTMLPGTDHLTVEGRKIHFKHAVKTKVYALHKPRNCITTLNDPEGRKTVKDFFPRDSGRLFPVGRLDYDAEGLLLLTNDGMLAHRLMHPRHKVWKSYFVKVKGLVTEEIMRTLRKGPKIDGRKHQPLRVKPIHKINDKMWLEVSLREGTNQQIKKMFLESGHRVLKIKRFKIGRVELGELMPGASRILTSEELDELFKDTEG